LEEALIIGAGTQIPGDGAGMQILGDGALITLEEALIIGAGTAGHLTTHNCFTDLTTILGCNTTPGTTALTEAQTELLTL
jgi:hypothetical protein